MADHHHETSHDWAIGQTLDAWGPSRFRTCVVVGLAALLVALIAGAIAGDGMQHFFFSYLHSFVFCLSLSLGALFFVVLQYLTRAGWSVVVRRLAENMAAAIVPLAALFLPVLLLVIFGSYSLYEWNNPAKVAEDPLISNKAPYLNAPFFAVRCLIYFGVWCGTALYFRKLSVAQDETGDAASTLKLEAIAPVCTFAFALSITFASIDWVMSLNAHWFSTIFGVYFFAGSMVGFFATMALIIIYLQQDGFLLKPVTVEHRHDIGKLLFGFTCFWAYCGFSQYMLIWYANIPEETFWYLERITNGWQFVAFTLVIGHFFLPFLILMPRDSKRSKTVLAVMACWMLLMHWIDLYWLIMPERVEGGVPLGQWLGLGSLIDLGCLVGMVSLYMAALLNSAGSQSLVPLKDPRLAESINFHNI
jgi:hypothetical protein